ncbi:MerR family transcriptional regulator [Lysinibacillus sp. NPDC047702]|uniref:MerR family transcriptional regulator n=1 Tax=unclassified Lysinibacillus TaxID=2636778 RepID=UPI003D013D3F
MVTSFPIHTSFPIIVSPLSGSISNAGVCFSQPFPKPAYLDKENRYRYYATSQLEDVLFIQRLKEYDFSLNEIKAIIADSQFLKPLIEMEIYETTQLMQKYSYLLTRMKTDVNNLTKGGNLMLNARNFVVEIVDNQKMNIFYIRKKMNVKDYGNVLGELFIQIRAKKLTPVGPPMTFFHSEDYIPENYDMEIAVPVLESNEGSRICEPHKCAKVNYIGLYDEVPKVYVQLQNGLMNIILN